MILAVARRIFAPVAIAFLLYFAWDGRESLLEMIRAGDPLQLPAAILAWSLMHLISPLLSMVIFRARSYSISYQTAADIHIANLPARYVPGGIWHTVGRIAGFKRHGIAQRDIGIYVFLENILAISVAFGVGGFLVASYHDLERWGLAGAFAAAGSLVLLMATPLILSYRVIQGNTRLKLVDYLASIGVVVVSWVLGAAAFIFYVSAFPAVDLGTSPLETAGAYLFSWGVGFVSVFAPQGIGVFEVMAAELLRGAAPLQDTAALLVGFRLVIMVADGLTWTARGVLSGIRRRPDKPTDSTTSGA